MLGMIKRNFIDRSKETIIPLYKSWVRHLQIRNFSVTLHVNDPKYHCQAAIEGLSRL